MEIAKDFAKRMTAQAQGIPREVVASLLERLMPRVPVARRAPAEHQSQGLPPPPIRDAFTRQATRTRKRHPVGRLVSYTLTDAGKYARHRGWRGAMVRAAQLHITTREAEDWLGANFPEYTAKGIDWSWLLSTAEYIRKA